MDALATPPSAPPAFDAIDRRRRALNLSQGELCRRADIDAVTYSRAKGGMRSQRRTLERLAAALDAYERERGR